MLLNGKLLDYVSHRTKNTFLTFWLLLHAWPLGLWLADCSEEANGGFLSSVTQLKAITLAGTAGYMVPALVAWSWWRLPVHPCVTPAPITQHSSKDLPHDLHTKTHPHTYMHTRMHARMHMHPLCHPFDFCETLKE